MRQGFLRPRQGSIKKPAVRPVRGFTESVALAAPIREENAVLPLTHSRSRAFAIRRRPLSVTDPRLPDAFVGIVAFGVTLGVAVATASAGKAVHSGYPARRHGE